MPNKDSRDNCTIGLTDTFVVMADRNHLARYLRRRFSIASGRLEPTVEMGCPRVCVMFVITVSCTQQLMQLRL